MDMTIPMIPFQLSNINGYTCQQMCIRTYAATTCILWGPGFHIAHMDTRNGSLGTHTGSRGTPNYFNRFGARDTSEHGKIRICTILQKSEFFTWNDGNIQRNQLCKERGI